MPREVTRHVHPSIQCRLWGLAAGRCEFAGCNKPLWKSPVTQEPLNVAEKAHIYSFSEAGPRGNVGLADEEINDLSNLMLLCFDCHQKIDDKHDGGRYTADLLKSWKKQHEERVRIASGIAADRRSSIVLYGANIGSNASPLSYQDAAAAMFPDFFPDSEHPIELSLQNSAFEDRDDLFWKIEEENLKRKFAERVLDRLKDRRHDHMSIFALAPQPLLMLFGTLLSDIPGARVYQRRREPQTWRWNTAAESLGLRVTPPDSKTGVPALILSLSAKVSNDRIYSVLGEKASIWRIDAAEPHNDILQTESQLAEFRSAVRKLMVDLGACYGNKNSLAVFPAVPVACAVEFGRVRMPKADMALTIYDEVRSRGGFVRAIEIGSLAGKEVSQ